MSTIEYNREKPPHLTAEPIDEKDDNKIVDAEHGGHVLVSEVKIAEEAMLHESSYTPQEYAKLVKKIDLYLLPLMWWCYGIQQTDKTALATMNLYGLQASTGMVGTQYSLLTVMFYTAYTIFEFPSNIMLQRFNMGKCLTLYMFAWGITVFVQAFLKDWASFMVLRFLQGAFECTISPGFNLIIANWYVTREHPSRALFFQSANAGWGVIVDLTMYGIAIKANANPGGFEAWRGIAVFLGGQTLLAASVCWFMLGTPNEVRWLSKEEKIMANARIMSNHAGTDQTGKKTFKWDHVKDAFTDPVTYFQFVNAFLSSVVNGALTTFGTVINASFGFTAEQVILYGIPRSIVSVIWFFIIGYTCSKVKGVRMYFMLFSILPPTCGLFGLAFLPVSTDYRWVKWGMYLMTVTFVVPLFSAWALISSNCAGRTKRSVVSSLVFIAYTTGNIAGSQVMKPADAPRYIPGTIAIACCVGVEFFVVVGWKLWLVYQNKKRAAIIKDMNITAEEAERRGQVLGAEDTTDMKNVFFEYAM